MNTCPNCGAEIRPGDNFCLNCGHRVAPLSPPPSAPQNDATALGGAPPYTFSGADDKTLAAPYPGAAAPSALDTIEHPAHLLVSLNNTNSTQQYLLEKTETTIGRAPNNDLALAEDKDKLISRYHATIRYENGNYILRDNGSANGTILNGQELEKKVDQPLRDGDKIAIGDYTLTYYAPASLANEHTMIGPDQSYGTVPTVAAPQEAGERVRAWQGGGGIPANTPPAPPPPPPAPAAPAAGSAAPSYAAEAPAPPLQPSPPPSPTQAEAKPAAPAISLQRFTQLAQPLPDFAALADATAALNGQIAALQQQLNNAQAATQGYQQELAETTNQFRAELRRVIDGINAAATAMAASRDELGIDRLKDLVQDVMHNPRDIDNARAFADRASSVNKLIQQHETALKTLQQWSARLFELTGKQE